MWVNKVAHIHVHIPNHTGTTEQAKDARAHENRHPRTLRVTIFTRN